MVSYIAGTSCVLVNHCELILVCYAVSDFYRQNNHKTNPKPIYIEHVGNWHTDSDVPWFRRKKISQLIKLS